jgi:hypothetical protein
MYVIDMKSFYCVNFYENMRGTLGVFRYTPSRGDREGAKGSFSPQVVFCGLNSSTKCMSFSVHEMTGVLALKYNYTRESFFPYSKDHKTQKQYCMSFSAMTDVEGR